MSHIYEDFSDLSHKKIDKMSGQGGQAAPELQVRPVARCFPMSALGRLRPFNPILAQCPLPGGKRTFQVGQFCENSGLFPECLLLAESGP